MSKKVLNQLDVVANTLATFTIPSAVFIFSQLSELGDSCLQK